VKLKEGETKPTDLEGWIRLRALKTREIATEPLLSKLRLTLSE